MNYGPVASPMLRVLQQCLFQEKILDLPGRSSDADCMVRANHRLDSSSEMLIEGVLGTSSLFVLADHLDFAAMRYNSHEPSSQPRVKVPPQTPIRPAL